MVRASDRNVEGTLRLFGVDYKSQKGTERTDSEVLASLIEEKPEGGTPRGS